MARAGKTRAWVLAILLLLQFAPARAHAELTIALLTVGPGDALYERFGHTGLRVRDGGFDAVYGFGAAPFGDPAFLWNFVQGRADFGVDVQPAPLFLARAKLANRTLQSQTLRLSADEAAKLVAALDVLTRPPNNHYRYDQLRDNCATRVRDAINGSTGGALKTAAARIAPSFTFRERSLAALAGDPFFSILLDVLGGSPKDRLPTGWEEMYLPLLLRDRLAEATRMRDGKVEPVAEAVVALSTRTGAQVGRSSPYAHELQLLALALVGLALSAVGARRNVRRLARLANACVAVFLAIMGLLGIVLCLIAFSSELSTVRPNLNVLVFWPSDLLWASSALRLRLPRVLRGYLRLRAGALGLCLCLSLTGVVFQQNFLFVLSAGCGLLALAVLTRSRASFPDPRTMHA